MLRCAQHDALKTARGIAQIAVLASLLCLLATGAIAPAEPPVNDRCETATLMTVGGEAAGTTFDAHRDIHPCGFSPKPGVWFKTIGTGDSLTATIVNTTATVRIYVFCGPCDYLGCLASCPSCGPQSATWCSAAGQEYWIFVERNSTTDADFTLSITSDEQACADPGYCSPPANDRCVDAEALDLGATVFGFTHNARRDSLFPCEAYSDYHQIVGFPQSSDPGVWYKVVGDGTTLRLSPELPYIVYCNDCDGPVCIRLDFFFDQDLGEAGAQWCSKEGEEYLIFTNESTDPGLPLVFSVTSTGEKCDLPHVCVPPPSPPLNDHCEDALPIAGVGEFAFDNRGAQYSPADCIVDYDTWYCWNAASSGDFTIETCGRTAVPTEVAVYDGCRCLTGATLACTYDEPFSACGLQSRISFSAQEGEQYLIQLGSSWKATGGGMGEFAIIEGTPAAAVSCSELARIYPHAVSEPCSPNGRWQALNSTRGRNHVVDDFTVADDAVIPDDSRPGWPSICWFGGYFDGTEECARSVPDDFLVTFHADDCGIPGDIIAGPFSQSGGTLIVLGPTPTGASLMGSFTEYAYSAVHDPVNLLEGTTYWLEITNGADGNCEWYWETSGRADGLSYQDGMSGSNKTSIDGYDPADATHHDAAFCAVLKRSFDPVCQSPPENDSCESPTVLSELDTFVHTYGATTDGLPVQSYSSLEPPCDFPLGDLQVNQDVWFDYVAECSGPVSLDLCGSGFDSKLAVYADLSCPLMSPPIACNDDACGMDPGLDAAISFQAVRGEVYRVRVGGFREATGVGTLHLGHAPPKITTLRSYASLAECFTGPCSGAPCPPLFETPCCAGLDFDADSDVDGLDHRQLTLLFLGP